MQDKSIQDEEFIFTNKEWTNLQQQWRHLSSFVKGQNFLSSKILNCDSEWFFLYLPLVEEAFGQNQDFILL